MAKVSKSLADPSLLAATLRGLEFEKQRVEEQIRYIRSLLGKDGLRAAKRAESNLLSLTIAAPKRRLSAEARQRIVNAQKKRWAEYRREHGKSNSNKKSA